MAIFSIRNFAIKQLMKAGDDGIMKMPSNMKADFAEAMLTKQLIDAGIDPRLIKNEQQLVNVLDGIDDMNRQLAEMATKEQTGITSAKIMDMKGKEIPKGSKIMGGEAVETEAEIAARMNRENKEAVERIKNKKMLDDAIEDASPGFADGDTKYDAELVAENLAARMGLVYDDLPTKQRIDLYDQAYKGLSKQRFKGMKKPDPEEKADGGRIGLRGGKDASQSDFKTPSTTAKAPPSMGFGNPPSGGNGGNGGNNNQPPKKIKIPEPVKSGIDTYNNLNYLKNIYKLNPTGIMLDIGKQFLMNKLFSEVDTQQNENMMVADLTDMQKKMLEGPQKNLKDIMGISNEEILKNIEKFNDPDAPATIQDIEQFYQQAKDGGRIGLKDGMDRRTFMKVMAGLASIPVVGKLFKGAKVASKAAPVAEKMVGTSTEAPTYFLKLVDKITKQGKPVTSTEDIMETYIYTAKNGDSYELVNDLKTGDLRITKDKTGIGTYGDKSFDTIEDRTVMEFRAGKTEVKDEGLETQKSFKEPNEYEEYKVEFDQDGTEAGAEAVEELVQKEIIEESAEEAPSIKKADGGRVGLLSGGGILRTIISNLAKSRNVKPSEYLKITNYKALPDSAKRIISKEDFLKLKSDMTEKRIEMMENIRDMIETRQGFEKSKAELAAGMNKASPGYGDEAVKMMFPEDKFPSPVPAGSGQKDVMMMEQLIKNLKTKDRQLNASGGVAYMLGE